MRVDVLQPLWTWENRQTVYLVHFKDGQRLELTGLHWGKDQGEAPHATADVVRVDLPGAVRPEAGSAIYFAISEVAQVQDKSTGAIIFEAV